MPDPRLTIALPQGLLERIEREAETSGKTKSAYAKSILEQHFAGQGVDQVRDHLAELTEAVHSMRSAQNPAPEPTQLTAEVTRLCEQVGALATHLQFTLRTLVFQKEDLRPTEQDFQALEDHWASIARDLGVSR